MSLAELLSDLRGDGQFMANVAAWRTRPACPPSYGPMPADLHPLLIRALSERGIEQLYSHQAASVQGALAGRHMAIVTPTASGKTLCYNLPVLHSLLRDERGRALYLFPTKALAHDQLSELHAWHATLDRLHNRTGASLGVATFDGDTPPGRRAAIRQSARLLLTNPDMLHMGILPNHVQWETFLSGLRFVVIDEMHVYRGVFGSHVANVLRRLRRICAFYGARPQFICASATIANPQELAQQLVEAPVAVVEETGAPQGEKHIILYNPPLYDEERGLRRSSLLESQELAARCVLAGQQTIVFGRARLTTELLLGYLRERLASALGEQTSAAIRGYRGGYLPQERRAIESGLRNGAIRAVVATNALELGIDIGRLQAAVLCGYPGTIAATWQQMGRAGRTTEAALAILVATGGPLDQYIIRNPEYIFERTPEHALINPDNLMLLVDQIRCAAFELPFDAGELFGDGELVDAVLALLAEQGELHRQGERYFWGGAGHPAREISLRSAGSDRVTIQAIHGRDGGHDATVIGEVERGAAVNLLHTGAIYWHEGQSYVVEDLDLQANLAHVRQMPTDYYTQVTTDSEIEILARHEAKKAPGASVAHGELRVTAAVLGYRRIKRFTHETLGLFPLDYPPATVETTGYWLHVSAEAQAILEASGRWYDSLNDYGPNWAAQRDKVRMRDRYRCTQCGAAEPPARRHDVHHLKPFRTFGYVPGLNDHYLAANRLDNLVLLCRACHQRLESGVRVRTGLDGLAYALNNLAPLYLMCDPQDLGVHVARVEATPWRAGEGRVQTAQGVGEDVQWETRPGLPLPAAPQGNAPEARQRPTIYLYERVTAGLGFSARLYELHAELMTAARRLVGGCRCRHGCPGCVGPVLDDAAAVLETKSLTLALLDVMQAA